MVKKIKRWEPFPILHFLVYLLIAVVSQATIVSAQELSPVGRWKTISDKNGETTSIVTITQENKLLVGKISELFRKPGQNPNPICKKCPDGQKDQPVIGLTILTDLQQDGDEWNGGEILDPDNGKTYSCFVKVIENGSKLEVRGYIGISLLGRTQTWVREECPQKMFNSRFPPVCHEEMFLKKGGSCENILNVDCHLPTHRVRYKARLGTGRENSAGCKV